MQALEIAPENRKHQRTPAASRRGFARPKTPGEAPSVHEVALLVRRTVARLCSQRAVRPCDVDDLTQHVLAHLFAHDARALSSWDPSHGLSFASYVCIISRRSAISALRRRDHNPRAERPADPSMLDDYLPHGASSEERLADRDHSRMLVQKLEEELSPLGRSVLHALYGEGLSIEAAGQALGLSAEALYAWRTRIRQRATRLVSRI